MPDDALLSISLLREYVNKSPPFSSRTRDGRAVCVYYFVEQIVIIKGYLERYWEGIVYVDRTRRVERDCLRRAGGMLLLDAGLIKSLGRAIVLHRRGFGESKRGIRPIPPRSTYGRSSLCKTISALF